MYPFINIIISPILFLLKNKNTKKKAWRDLSDEIMLSSHEEINNRQKFNFKELILLFLLNILSFLLSKNSKYKKNIRKKIPGNYHPLN